MSHFPIYLELEKKNLVVIGGGKVALRKIRTLLKFGALIKVISPEFCHELKELEACNSNLDLKRGTYKTENLEGAFLVFACTSNKDVNEKVCKEAKERNVLVNVCDSKEDSDFIFPSIIKKGDLVIGVSTSGGYPMLNKFIRERIEDVLPDDISEALEKLKVERSNIINLEDSEESKSELLTDLFNEYVLRWKGMDLKK